MNKIQIPNILWTFWHDPTNMPEIVQTCIQSWKRINPTYTVQILNMKDAEAMGITKLRHATNPTRISDFIRIHVLETYGGIWMDASMYCGKSLQWIHDEFNKDASSEAVLFYLGDYTSLPQSPVVENWFIAAPPYSPFIREWKEEFYKINDFTYVKDYAHTLKHIDTQGIYDPDYLAMHVAAQVVLQTSHTHTLALLKAEEGPYAYLANNGWDFEQAKKNVFENGTFKQYKLIKFRAGERKKMTQEIVHMLQ